MKKFRPEFCGWLKHKTGYRPQFMNNVSGKIMHKDGTHADQSAPVNSLLYYIFSFILFALISFPGFAQKASISGTVTDKDKQPLIGAIIKLENTTIGTTIDINGNFKLENLDTGKVTLVISYIGFIPQKKSFNLTSSQNETLNIILKEDALLLQEVVIVGYGNVQRRDVTGSIVSIKSDEIKSIPLPSFEQALQGKAAGVQITSANGLAGGPVKVNIRGTNSITAGGEPLYVIDGIPMTTGDFSAGSLGSRTSALSDLNPNDIESIDIMKDASAAAIYGSRGANGVVIITTKKGKSGKTKFDFDYSYGIISETNRLKLLSASEQLALRDRAADEAGIKRDSSNTVIYYTGLTRGQADSMAALGGSKWMDAVMQRGSLEQANISAAGGNEKTTFYIGGSYRDEKSFLVGNRYQRISTRINLDNKATEKIKLGTNLSLTYSINNRVPIGDAGGLGAAQQIPDFVPIYNSDGTFYNPNNNPVWELQNHTFTADVFRTIAGVYADIQIIKDLSFRTEFSIDNLNQIESEFKFRNTQDTGSVSDAWDRRTNVFNWNTNNYFTYTKKYKEHHNFDFTLGNSIQNSYSKGVGLHGWGFSNDYFHNPGNAPSANQAGYGFESGFAFDGYFARVNYKLKEKYLASVSIRRDGSSRFGIDNRYGWFPAFSAGWIVSDEKFMEKYSFISFLKLRSSYGYTGNANIGDFAHLGYYVSTGGYNGSPALVPSTLANPALQWEKSAQFDINMDISFLKNRISLSASYYDKRSKDLLLYVAVPTSSGYGSVLKNVGSLKNNGVELTLSTKNMVKKISWTTDFNIAFNRNKVLDAAGLDPDAFESGEPGEGRVLKGYPVGQSYLVPFAGVQQADGQLPLYNTDGSTRLDAFGNQMYSTVKAGTELFYDQAGNLMTYQNPTGNFYQDNRRPMGKPLPDFIGGITNKFAYKGFDFSFMFVWVYGNTIYDDPAKNQIGRWESQAQRPEILDAWTAANQSNTTPSLNSYTVSVNSSRFLYDASFLRLRSVTLGYEVPEKWTGKMHLQQMRIFINGANLWTWTKYPGWDPEVLRNVNPNSQQGNISFSGPSYQTPQSKMIMAGIKIGF